MKIGIHQPNYLPYPGYFYKIWYSDEFIILDNVQFQSGNSYSVINRNKIKTSNGLSILTVPVKKASLSTLVNNIEIDYTQNWQKKHLKTIEFAYNKTPFFNEFFPLLERTLMIKYDKLFELNVAILQIICSYLSIKTRFTFSSQLFQNNNIAATERLIEILKTRKATEYLSGKGGLKYMDTSLFASNNIKLTIISYQSIEYPQMYGEFAPNLSIIDLVFNCGTQTVLHFLGQ